MVKTKRVKMHFEKRDQRAMKERSESNKKNEKGKRQRKRWFVCDASCES